MIDLHKVVHNFEAKLHVFVLLSKKYKNIGMSEVCLWTVIFKSCQKILLDSGLVYDSYV